MTGSCAGKKKKEPGAHCSHMHQEICIPLCYSEVMVEVVSNNLGGVQV